MKLDFGLDFSRFYAGIWRANGQYLHGVKEIDKVRLDSLFGIEQQKRLLIKNTEQFLANKGALNALLWGARGTGKSSLIKALLYTYASMGLRIVELDNSSLKIAPELIDSLREQPYFFIIFCDDLSFEAGDSSYKPLKSLLEGSIERIPKNIIIYATSNRRHLMPEYLNDNIGVRIGNGEIHMSDAIDEKSSLADRFALSLGFYQGSLRDYFEVVKSYIGSECPKELEQQAINFATQRGSRSARVARQFYDLYRSGLIE